MRPSTMQRRTFLSSAAATAAGSLASSSVAAARPPAEKRLRAGFIGMGRRGRGNLRAVLDRDDVKVVALCDVFKPNLDLAAKMAPDAKLYDDFRDVIAATGIDLLCIATPDHWHAYMTIEACKAGKDVYVEKPISVTVHEGQMMVKAARKYGRVVQAGTQQRSGVHFQKAVEIVQSGRLGDISFVRTWNYGNEFPEGIGNPADSAPPGDLDWDLWLGPAPLRPFNANRFGVSPVHYSRFRWFWDYAGGMMTDWGIHLLDIVLWAMNEKGPRAIMTAGGKYALKDDRETPDTILATYEFPGFACVYENRVANAQTMGAKRYGIVFHGTEASLFVDRSGWELLPEYKRVEGSRRDETARMSGEKGYSVNDTTDAHWENFIDAIRTRGRPRGDIELAHRSTVMSLLGNVSLRSRQRVQWDPETETTPNKEAQTYLRREYRDPWKLTL